MSGVRYDLARDALWYAFGRQDAGERRVDPVTFSEHYNVLVGNAETGVTTYRPSIQDAYNDYLKGIN